MQARCPQCETLFNITQRHLNMANGRVRCNQCHTVFDGYAALIDDNAPPELDSPVDDGFDIDLSKAKGNRVDITPDQEVKPSSLIYGDLLEDDYDKPKRFVRTRAFLSGMLVLLLLTLLFVQFVYLKREMLSEHPLVGAWVTQACDHITPCSIPKKRALDQLKLESRHIYGHPNISGALVVSASFSNQASHHQQYPTLVISMSNVRGQEVAARRFAPEEYLTTDSDPGAGMNSGDSVTIHLEIADPGNDAMAFEIDFL